MKHEEFIRCISLINENIVVNEEYDYEPWLRKQNASLADAASWLAVEILTYGRSNEAERAYKYHNNDEAFFGFIASLYRKYGSFDKVANALVDRKRFQQAHGKDLAVLLKRAMLPNAAERKTTTYKWLQEFIPNVLDLDTDEGKTIAAELDVIVKQFDSVMALPNPDVYFGDARKMLQDLIDKSVPPPVAHGEYDEHQTKRNSISRLGSMLNKARSMSDLKNVIEHIRFALG